MKLISQAFLLNYFLLQNELFNYIKIPIILYCIEKNAIKCFKYALINGADLTQKSVRHLYTINSNIYSDYEHTMEMWDGYGFAGAIGSIQIIKLIEDQGIPINGDLIKGSSKFHQNHIIHWAEKEYKPLLKDGMKECIQFSNYEVFDMIIQNFDVSRLIYPKNKTPLHYAAKYNSKGTFFKLLSEGVNINVIDLLNKKIVIMLKRKIQ